MTVAVYAVVAAALTRPGRPDLTTPAPTTPGFGSAAFGTSPFGG